MGLGKERDVNQRQQAALWRASEQHAWMEEWIVTLMILLFVAGKMFLKEACNWQTNISHNNRQRALSICSSI